MAARRVGVRRTVLRVRCMQTSSVVVVEGEGSLSGSPLEAGLCGWSVIRQRKASYHVLFRKATDREWRRRRLVLPDSDNKRGCTARERSDLRRVFFCPRCAGLQLGGDCRRVWPGPGCLLCGWGADTLSTMHNPSVCLGAPSTASFSSSSTAGGVKKPRHSFTLFYLSDLSLWGFNRAFVCLQRTLMNCINYFTGTFNICSAWHLTELEWVGRF